MNRNEAEALLRKSVGKADAEFHPGQWEAIDALVNRREKMLVVQRTGWGKSSVYFISTRILRERGMGPTIIVSPLLALMRNQADAADALGVQASSINSSNRGEWDRVVEDVRNDRVDALLISPERLANEEFTERVLDKIADRIGLFVVDEVHCISDWGHDFRPDYQRLVNVLKMMPPNTPVLGTTATANDRVIEDVKNQLGDIEVQRGSLMRKSLKLQTLRLAGQAERLAWLAQNIPCMPGTGIVYTLTTRDAEQVADWLNSQGVDARAYHGSIEHEDFEDSNAYRQKLERLLRNNEIKVLVATTALGMGYDKPDLNFVIHYQASGSVVAYYQQVGRAGRAIDEALGIMMAGREDTEIHEYFRSTAFPSEGHVNAILAVLAEHDGLSVAEIEQFVNIGKLQIEKVLKMLSVENPAPVIKQGWKWSRLPVRYRLDHERINRLTQQRELEWRELQDYIDSDGCLMAYLRDALDDPEAGDCGKCMNCQGQPVIPVELDRSLTIQAARILRHSEIWFKSKIRIPAGALAEYQLRGNLPPDLRAEKGRILSRWGDAGWGQVVSDDKHRRRFRDELVDAVVDMIESRWSPTPSPEWVTCVPSMRRPELVSDFSRRLAERLGLPFVEVIRRSVERDSQKLQKNTFHQCSNLDGVFSIAENIPETPVFLVDDIIDSGWTMTVLTALLKKAGSGDVYPVALALASPGGY